MEKLLARLERRLGRFAVPNLTIFIVAGMAAVFALSLVRPGFRGMLDFDRQLVMHGQVWRLVTYVFIPTEGTIWALVNIYFLWWVGTTLESHWGSFKYNVFWLVGVTATTAAAFAGVGEATNVFLSQSLFLAFATLFPDETILLIVLPVRAKWLGWLAAAFLGYLFVTGGWPERVGLLAAFGNYLLFFAGHWIDWFNSRRVLTRQRARRAQMTELEKPRTGGRVCAICGASEDAGADIRVCSCEKCGGKPRNLCLEHARNH